jgi:hypothetical protein
MIAVIFEVFPPTAAKTIILNTPLGSGSLFTVPSRGIRMFSYHYLTRRTVSWKVESGHPEKLRLFVPCIFLLLISHSFKQ